MNTPRRTPGRRARRAAIALAAGLAGIGIALAAGAKPAADPPPRIADYRSWEPLKQSAYSLYYLKRRARAYTNRLLSEPGGESLEAETAQREALQWVRASVKKHAACLRKRVDHKTTQANDLLETHAAWCWQVLRRTPVD